MLSWIAFWVSFAILGCILVSSSALTIVAYQHPRRQISIHQQSGHDTSLTVSQNFASAKDLEITGSAQRSQIFLSDTTTVTQPTIIQRFASQNWSMTADACLDFYRSIFWMRVSLVEAVQSIVVDPPNLPMFTTGTKFTVTGPTVPISYFKYSSPISGLGCLTKPLPLGEWVFQVEVVLTCPSYSGEFSVTLGTLEEGVLLKETRAAMLNGVLCLTTFARVSLDGGQITLSVSSHGFTPAPVRMEQCTLFMNRLAGA